MVLMFIDTLATSLKLNPEKNYNMIHLNKFTIKGLLGLSLVVVLASCNKDLEQFPEAATPPPSGLSLTETIAATPSDSLYNRLLIKSGLGPTFNNKATSFTMFVPDNNGMKIFINAIIF